jgi:hypothetical protein
MAFWRLWLQQELIYRRISTSLQRAIPTYVWLPAANVGPLLLIARPCPSLDYFYCCAGHSHFCFEDTEDGAPQETATAYLPSLRVTSSSYRRTLTTYRTSVSIIGLFLLLFGFVYFRFADTWAGTRQEATIAVVCTTLRWFKCSIMIDLLNLKTTRYYAKVWAASYVELVACATLVEGLPVTSISVPGFPSSRKSYICQWSLQRKLSHCY